MCMCLQSFFFLSVKLGGRVELASPRRHAAMHWGSMVGSVAWGDRWSSGAFDTGAASRKRPGGSAGGCGYGGCGVGTTYVLRTVPNSSAEVLGDSPPVIQVHLPPHSPIASSGFTAAAPAISFDKAYTIFSIASSLLNELVDDGSVDVAMDHDPEWQRFPEVGEQSVGRRSELLCPRVVPWPAVQ